MRIVVIIAAACACSAGTHSQSQPLQPPRSDPNAAYAAKAAGYMEARARITGFSGAVLVARNGETLFRSSHGMANHELGVPNTPETRFRLGSAGKQFTAAAILVLEQQGKLKVGDPVDKYLTGWPKAWGAVTVHHLLSHTSGLPRMTTQTLLDVSGLSSEKPGGFRELADVYKPGEEQQPLDAKPGEQFNYSNVGFILLHLIVEKASEQPFCEFLAGSLFSPLGMTNTACEDPSMIVPRRASGYVRSKGALTNAPYADMRSVNGAGSIYSTIDDLVKWDRALASNRILNADATTRLFTPVKNKYAYGWWVQTRFKHPVEWHGGNIPGHVAQITRHPDLQLFIVVFSNIWSGPDRSQVRAISYELAAMALDESYELPREHKEVKLDPATYDAFVGNYAGKDEFAIAREGDRLIYQFPPGNNAFEIVPESADAFFWKNAEYYFTFHRDPNGNVNRVSIRSEGETDVWTKKP
jgi:CubicO group peptidase (beta-lactamase class C family)